MNEPEIGKAHTFIKKRGNAFDVATFTRYQDGSALCLADGSVGIFECHPDAWRLALAKLVEEGYVELAEAKRSEMISSDWQPASERSTSD